MRKKLLFFLLLIIMLLIGCNHNQNNEGMKIEDLKEGVFLDSYEAEDGILQGNVKIEKIESGFSGNGYVTGFKEEEDQNIITIQIPEDGFYDFEFILSTIAGYKENKVFLDNENIGLVALDSEKFDSVFIRHIYIEKGEHVLGIKKFWGWIHWDKTLVYKSVELPVDFYEVRRTLVNDKANENTKRLFSYLCDSYGKSILSGQYCDTGMSGWEIKAITEETIDKKAPAILGLDFIDYSASRIANGTTPNQTELAINYWEKGGIVTFCWHWNAPEKYLTSDWWRGFYTDATNIDLEAIFNGNDPEGYELLMQDIDGIATELQVLRDAGVPILWRPLHEASGGWFWWGDSGKDVYKELYVLLYDKLTNEYGLNNLIWVWNGQDAEWYPGDEYVDIIGMDIYADKHDYTSQINSYLEVKSWSEESKMVVLSENGVLFDPDLAVRDGAMWGMFCTWQREFVVSDGIIKKYSEEYTSKEMLKKVYENDYVITRDELPDLLKYPINE